MIDHLKKFFFIPFLAILFFVSVSASNVTLYRDVNSDSSIVNRLIDIYRNQLDYDPQQDYVVYSDSQYTYTLAYGDLANTYNWIRYTQSYNYNPASLAFGSGSNLSISDNGFLFTGNVPGSQRSERADNYAFRLIIILAVTFILILIIFKTLHKRINLAPSKGYTIK